MEKDPRDFRVRMVDAFDESVSVEFLITPRARNCSRLMRQKQIPVICVEELACYLAASRSLAEQGEGGMTMHGFKRLLDMLYAGRDLHLSLAGLRLGYPRKDSCSSSSTESDAVSPDEPPAPTSTETSPSPPVDPASETPDSSS